MVRLRNNRKWIALERPISEHIDEDKPHHFHG